MGNTFIDGEMVLYKGEMRTIYSVYDNENVSLCLLGEDGEEYEDVEEDYQTPIKELSKINLVD